MSESSPTPASPRPESGPTPPGADDELEQLRQILLGPERRDLARLKEQVENPLLRAQGVSSVLPQAIVLSAGRNDQLAKALAPAVDSMLHESVRRNPAVLVDAIFPVMGPAIRKAISEALAKLIQAVSRTMENTFTVRGLRWRFEALRTGRSFAEVVLYHTLVFRVEQIFLIHRQSGLLLQHLQLPHIVAQDSDMVSGMLTAIQDFVRDSFRVEQGDQLQTMQVGDLNVWIESGPQAILAAVIRGHAPVEFRESLQEAVELIHREQGPELAAFSGDARPFALARTHLEPCLREQFGGEEKPRRSRWRLWLALAAGAALVLLWSALEWRENRRWENYVARVRAVEGLVVTEVDRRGGKFHLRGLRDPLAADPALLLADSGLDPAAVVSRWEPYQALGASFVLQRAVRILQPPSTVTLRLNDGVLTAAGTATAGWIDRATVRAPLIPGVNSLNTDLLDSPRVDLLSDLRRQVESAVLVFGDGVALAPGEEAGIAPLVAQINELRSAALQSGVRLSLTLVGHTDKTGPEQFNARLSQERAEAVHRRLLSQGLGPVAVDLVGVGPRVPRRAGMTEAEERLNRRVTFRVSLDRAASP